MAASTLRLSLHRSAGHDDPSIHDHPLSRPARQGRAGDRRLARHRAATCRALAASGAKVAVNGRDEAAIQAVVASIRDAGGQAMAAPADCASLADTRRMAGELRQAWGEPDLLAAFAGGGTGRPQPLGEISEQDWRSSLDNNLTSTFFTLQCFLPGMIARRGQRGDDGLGRRPRGLRRAGRLAPRLVIMLTRHAAVEREPAGCGQLPVSVGGADRADRLADAGCAASRHAAGVSAGAPGETDDGRRRPCSCCRRRRGGSPG